MSTLKRQKCALSARDSHDDPTQPDQIQLIPHPPMSIPTKGERLAEVFRRLQNTPPASTHDEAFEQLADIINDVEDDLTDIPFDPDAWESDGRLYAPQADNKREVEGRPDVIRYRSVKHNTYIAQNGAIEIITTSGAVEFTKLGQDGNGVWEK